MMGMAPANLEMWRLESPPMAVEQVERKLAAILAADVVGYSRLMGADEAGTHARLKALRKALIEPKIAECRGRTVELTGDGALVSSRAWSTRCSARSRSSEALPSTMRT